MTNNAKVIFHSSWVIKLDYHFIPRRWYILLWGSFINYLRYIFIKNTFLTHWYTHVCVYQWVRKVAHVLNEWSLFKISLQIIYHGLLFSSNYPVLQNGWSWEMGWKTWKNEFSRNFVWKYGGWICRGQWVILKIGDWWTLFLIKA